MKIAMVSEHASPLAMLGSADAGGQNVHVAELAAGLGALGADVVVHTRRDDPALDDRVPFCPGVEVHHVCAGPPRPVPKDELLPYMERFAEELFEDWAADPPDVVHAHFWMSAMASLEAARPLGIPVAVTFHALGSEKRRNQGSKDTSPESRIRTEQAIARDVDLVVATATEERKELLRLGADGSRIAVVPCGVDLARFRPRTQPHRPNGRLRVVSVARLVERKGVGNVIEAVAQLPDVEYLVAGGPPPTELDLEPEAVRLQSIARSHGCADRVTLLGQMAHSQVPYLLRSADVVVSAPWYEPFGIVAVEAMACGIPVVASAVGGQLDTVVDGVTGLHIPPRSPEAVAEALSSLAGDPEWRAALGAAGARRARRGYGWHQVAARTHQLYRRTVERKPVPSTAQPLGGVA